MNRKMACGLFLAMLGAGLTYFVIVDSPGGFMRFFAGWLGLVAVTVGLEIALSK